MDRTRDTASGRSDPSPEERWLREALTPGEGVAKRAVRAALVAGGRQKRSFVGVLGYAAAAVLAVGFGALLFLGRPASAPPAQREPRATGSFLLTNASGPVRLVRMPPDRAPLPPLVRPGPSGECTTLYWSRGSVLAVYESCGDGTIRIEGGAS